MTAAAADTAGIVAADIVAPGIVAPDTAGPAEDIADTAYTAADTVAGTAGDTAGDTDTTDIAGMANIDVALSAAAPAELRSRRCHGISQR